MTAPSKGLLLTIRDYLITPLAQPGICPSHPRISKTVNLASSILIGLCTIGLLHVASACHYLWKRVHTPTPAMETISSVGTRALVNKEVQAPPVAGSAPLTTAALQIPATPVAGSAPLTTAAPQIPAPPVAGSAPLTMAAPQIPAPPVAGSAPLTMAAPQIPAPPVAGSAFAGAPPAAPQTTVPYDSIREDLCQLETIYRPLHGMLEALLQNPTLVPQRTEAERERAKKAVDALEATLIERYRGEFNCFVAHGAASWSRMLWQDIDCIEALNKKENVQELILRHKEGRVTQVSDDCPVWMTFSSLLLFGLKDNLLPYLITASPNWVGANRHTRFASEGYLAAFKKSMDAIRGVLQELLPISVPKEDARVRGQIEQASIQQLYDAIPKLLTSKNASTFIGGLAGPSTDYMAMVGQCFFDMEPCDRVLKTNNNDLAKVLNGGEFSHPLDARHLLAGISFSSKEYASASPEQGGSPWESHEQKEKIKAGCAFFKNFIGDVANGNFGQEATDLIAFRLRQALSIIVDLREKSQPPIELSSIEEALRGDTQTPATKP